MPSRKSAEIVDHDELVAELVQVEKLSTAERLKHARKRRQQQLKKFSQYEKQLEKEHMKKSKKGPLPSPRQKKKNRNVNFVNNIRLLEAASRNDVAEVRKLLESKVSPDVTNEDGLTALHQCCIDELKEMLELLIEHGANVNARDSELWTPLHAAATCGHVHLCKILIDSGAELLAVNADGNMPYDICEDETTLDFIENEMAKRGVTQEQIDETRLSTEKLMLTDLKQFVDAQEDLEFKGRYGETPLHIAAANGYEQVTEFLLNQHVSIDVQDNDGWQPIHAAACWGHLPILELLVQHGADLEAKTRTGESPFDICEDIEMKDRMMELKVEIETKGIVRSRHLVRRRSTNTRSSVVSNSGGSIYNSSTSLAERHSVKSGSSASVRRSSMREKAAISWKEALEEGRRIRESSVSNDEDDEEEKKHQARLPLENGDSGDESSRSPVETDDIKVDVMSSGFMADSEHSDSPSPKNETTLDSSSPRQDVATAAKNTNSTFFPANGKKVSVKSSPAASPEVAAKTSPKANHSARVNDSQQNKSQVKKSAPPQPQLPPADTSKGDADIHSHQPVAVEEKSNESKPEESSGKQQAGGDRLEERRPSQDLLHEYNSRETSTQPLTLADLKKQRAHAMQQRLEASMRNKDPEQMQRQIDDFNSPYSTSSDQEVTLSSNKASYQPPRASQKNGGPVNEADGRKYKFRDNQVLETSKEDTSCCLLQ